MNQSAQGPAASDAVLLSASLTASSSSAGHARRLLRDVLQACVSQETLDTVLLLTTELVGNAVNCVSTDCHLRVVVGDDRVLRVEVADTNDDLPQIMDRGPHAEKGRGLRLVDALADGWGVSLNRPGKIVWFILDLTLGRRALGASSTQPILSG